MFRSLAVFERLFPVCSSIFTSSCRSFSSSERITFSSGLTLRSSFILPAVIQPLVASSMALRTVFLSSLMFPGHPYSRMAAMARQSNPWSETLCSLEKRSRKNFAMGSMSSGHSDSRGTLMVNSLRRWNRSSRKRPSVMAFSRFSLVAANRRMSKRRSFVEPTCL